MNILEKRDTFGSKGQPWHAPLAQFLSGKEINSNYLWLLPSLGSLVLLINKAKHGSLDDGRRASRIERRAREVGVRETGSTKVNDIADTG